jgi:hypothetical protein
MSGPAQDVVAEVQADHRSLLSDLYGIARLGPSEQAARFWAIADRLVRRELAMELAVYPVIAPLPEAATLTYELAHEQGLILGRLFQMEQETPVAGEPFELELSRLRVAVADHIGHEEAEVVPLLIGSIPSERRSAMALEYRLVRDVESAAAEREPPPTRTIVGRLAALAEWIRDSASASGRAVGRPPSPAPTSLARPAADRG